MYFEFLEILPPHTPTPPLIIKTEDPESSTPSLPVLHELPLTAPANQETKIITKTSGQNILPSKDTIVEHPTSVDSMPILKSHST